MSLGDQLDMIVEKYGNNLKKNKKKFEKEQSKAKQLAVKEQVKKKPAAKDIKEVKEAVLSASVKKKQPLSQNSTAAPPRLRDNRTERQDNNETLNLVNQKRR